MIDKIKEYVGAVALELKSGVATEHSYRPCLKALLEALLPGQSFNARLVLFNASKAYVRQFDVV